MNAIQAGSAEREDRGTALAKIPTEPLDISFWKYLKLVGGAEVILSFLKNLSLPLCQKKKKSSVFWFEKLVSQKL